MELYNSVLDHLGAVVSSKSLQRLSWPISEFTKNEERDHGTKKNCLNLEMLHLTLICKEIFVEELEMFHFFVAQVKYRKVVIIPSGETPEQTVPG